MIDPSELLFHPEPGSWYRSQSFIASWRGVELARLWQDSRGYWRVSYRTGTTRVIDRCIRFRSEWRARVWVRANMWALPCGQPPRRSDPPSRAA
jgi:hypothetical protein